MNNHLDIISEEFEQLQEQGCAIIEECDGACAFSRDYWSKDIGFGTTRVLSEGKKIIKGALNYSKVRGPLSQNMSKALGVNAKEFAATGISSIFHARNPHVPSVHMNVRYFAFDNGLEWFGGGIDLTPVYIDVDQARYFHSRLKAMCDQHDSDFYPHFKKWADDYYFIKHRNETRGVGGIFFDRQQPTPQFNFQHWMNFASDLASLYPNLYQELVQQNHSKAYTTQNQEWQKIRWGRYAEFNLVYDRGTKFGLESKGNTESILISLPPEVKWEYQFQVKTNSKEAQTQELLKKDIDWVNIKMKMK